MGMIFVGGVIEKDGKFLLIQEAKEKCRGKWNLPIGHLEQNETFFEGTKREIYEECGCSVELSGVLSVSNMVLKNDTGMVIIFSTNLIDDSIKFDKNEILDVKWFTYEEIIAMKNELRSYDLVINAISAYVDDRIINIDVVKIIE